MRRTLLSRSLRRPRPHVSLQSASHLYACDATDSHAYVGKPTCIVHNDSHPVSGHCTMVAGSRHHSERRYPWPNMDRCLSPTLPIAYASHSYAATRMFKPPIYTIAMANYMHMHSTEADTLKTQCWTCGRSKSEKGFLICPSCNAVQPPDPGITYFEIFDQDQSFELDLKDLETKYKSLMKILHPDLTHGKSTEEKEHYAQWSALVTTAYTELLKPVSRATYLLKLRGICVEEEGTVTDSDLIMEVMDIRETLQSRPDRKTLEQLNKRATARMDDWSVAFKTALKEGNDAAAVGALQRMSYFGRVCEDISRELL